MRCLLTSYQSGRAAGIGLQNLAVDEVYPNRSWTNVLQWDDLRGLPLASKLWVVKEQGYDGTKNRGCSLVS